MNSNTTHTQNYDVNKAVWLYHQEEIKASLYDKCSNDEDLKVNIEKLNKFLLDIVWNDGKLNVKYTRNNDYGRWFSNGIQGISRKVRGFLLHDKGILDIDMKNAHPVILNYLKKINHINVSTPYLDEYVNNRDEVFKTHFKGDKENGKKQVLIATNCDECKSSNVWLNKYFKDVCDIRDGLKKVKDYKVILKNSEKKKNKDGSFMNHILCMWEENILNEAILYLQERKYKPFSYMMDRVMMYERDG